MTERERETDRDRQTERERERERERESERDEEKMKKIKKGVKSVLSFFFVSRVVRQISFGRRNFLS